MAGHARAHLRRGQYGKKGMGNGEGLTNKPRSFRNIVVQKDHRGETSPYKNDKVTKGGGKIIGETVCGATETVLATDGKTWGEKQ